LAFAITVFPQSVALVVYQHIPLLVVVFAGDNGRVAYKIPVFYRGEVIKRRTQRCL